MVSSPAATVPQYIASLPADRRAAVKAVRKVVNANLPAGFKEGMQYGMIGWYVPLSRYPDTYNGQPLGIAALASQKNHLSLYLMGVYGHEPTRKWFEKAFAAAGKKLNMGKSCVRFRSADDLPLDVIAEVISRISVEDFLAMHETARPAKKKTAKKKAAKKKAAKKKTAKKKTAKKKR